MQANQTNTPIGEKLFILRVFLRTRNTERLAFNPLLNFSHNRQVHFLAITRMQSTSTGGRGDLSVIQEKMSTVSLLRRASY